jgi:hypothetical protein
LVEAVAMVVALAVAVAVVVILAVFVALGNTGATYDYIYRRSLI